MKYYELCNKYHALKKGAFPLENKERIELLYNELHKRCASVGILSASNEGNYAMTIDALNNNNEI